MTILNGTTDSDTLLGGNSEDILDGSAGNDTISGGNFDDSLDGDSGDDLINGGNHDDSLDGGSGDDLINGGNHDDSLDGGSGDDLINGGNHDDFLDGGSGNDSLSGDIGRDTLTGGDGSDCFIFETITGLDLITDFDALQGDKIVFNSATTGISEVGDLTVYIGSSYDNNTYSPDRVTSLYFDGARIIEFDSLVTLEVENFEFV